MAFPTATITEGSGLTINTYPNAGQSTMANSLSGAIASDQNPLKIASLSSTSVVNPVSTFTRSAGSVTSAVTATNSTPCIFTWTAHPSLGGSGTHSLVLGGTPPTGFTANVPYYAESLSADTFQLSTTVGGTPLGSTDTGTAVTATICYAPDSIAIAPGYAVSSFSIPTSGVIIPRVRFVTNITSGWNNVLLAIKLWSAVPTYVNADGGVYDVATGSANWLGRFLITLTQFGDGAVGAAGLDDGDNQLLLQLASGTTVFWDIKVRTLAFPAPSQTFTLIPELIN